MAWSAIQPNAVRYIKLGETGSWEKECLENGIIRFGFGTAEIERFNICQDHRWDDLRASFVEGGKDKTVSTRFTNEAKAFFLDPGTTLWITFMGRTLHWGFTDGGPAEPHPDMRGVYRRMRDGWHGADIHGERLTMDRLSGRVTKLQGYRGTSCSVDDEEYVIRRINGQKLPQVEDAITAQAAMHTALIPLMRLLVPHDFELLVELVFAGSGYRRIEAAAGTEKTIDLDLELPLSGKRAFVQIKSRTNSAQLAEYVSRIEEHHDEMFYAFHTGSPQCEDSRVTLLGPEVLAKMVFNAGLSDWLIRKTS